jgi:hypothetical protein
MQCCFQRMHARTFPAILSVTAALALSAQTVVRTASDSGTPVALQRSYKPREMLRYEMSGSNHGWNYQINAREVVKQDSAGNFYEEIGWSNLRSNAPMTLSPASLAFRQTLSLTASQYLAVPDLGKVQPFLIGPITDMLTFYSDLYLAGRKLDHLGQHVQVPHGKPNSWADGQRILMGQDAIDFDLTLLSADPQKHTATILVRHVPPEHPQIKLPAKWMEAPVADTPNNWVQVEKNGDKYIAQVGKEVFEVKLQVDTRDGKILAADLHNPVTAVRCDCQDAALTQCSAATPQTILRQVNLHLIP